TDAPLPCSTLFPYTTLFRSLGLDLLYLRLGARLHELRFAQALRRQHTVHDLLQVAGEDQVLDVRSHDADAVGGGIVRADVKDLRSEEHTSELQSQSNLVCRL